MRSKTTSFLKYLYEQKHYANNTIAAYQNDLNQFVLFATQDSATPINDWSEMTSALIDEYIDYLDKQQYAPTTITRKIATIKSMANYLNLRIGRTVSSRNLVNQRLKRPYPRSLDGEEVQQLLSIAERGNSPKAIRDFALLRLLFSTGMRVSEVVLLQLTSIDLDGKLVECGEDSRQTRQIPLEDAVVLALRRYLTEARSRLGAHDHLQALFVNHRGNPLTRQGLWMIIKSYAEFAGLSMNVTPNVLRHSFAKQYLKQGGTIHELQRLLGHANLATTQIYVLNPSAEDGGHKA